MQKNKAQPTDGHSFNSWLQQRWAWAEAGLSRAPAKPKEAPKNALAAALRNRGGAPAIAEVKKTASSSNKGYESPSSTGGFNSSSSSGGGAEIEQICSMNETFNCLVQTLTAWSRSRLSQESNPPALLPSVRAVATKGCPQMEASMIWFGVLVRLQVQPSQANRFKSRLLNFVSASSDCQWEHAQSAISTAAAISVGQRLEVFLDELMQAWNKSMNSQQKIVEAEDIQQSAPLTHPTQEESGDFENLEDYDDGEFEYLGSFEEWLASRPPLFRFDQASRGLAWDYPPSRQEKKELLLLQLFAEERERQEQMAAVQACQPRSPTVSRKSLP